MRWSNLFIIFRREVRDQIRDRCTLRSSAADSAFLSGILGIGVTALVSRSSRSRDWWS